MGVESVSVSVALSHADILEISCHSLTGNPWKAKDIQAIEAIYSTNVHIQNH